MSGAPQCRSAVVVSCLQLGLFFPLQHTARQDQDSGFNGPSTDTIVVWLILSRTTLTFLVME